MNTTEVLVTLVQVSCGECGVVFGLSQRHCEGLRESHQTFYCPNGHPRAYLSESKAEKTERLRANAVTRLEQAEAQLVLERDQREATERQLAATKGVVTKLKKRVVAGTCPVGCRRHFADLQAHIETKHPDYGKEHDHV